MYGSKIAKCRGQGNRRCVTGSVQRGRDKVDEAMERKEHSSCEMGGKLSVTLMENKMKGPRVVTHRARRASLENGLGAIVTH